MIARKKYLRQIFYIASSAGIPYNKIQKAVFVSYIRLFRAASATPTAEPGGGDLPREVSDQIPRQDEEHELHRLLGTMLSREMPEKERLEILDAEYEFPENGGAVRKDVKEMCNLSEGIWRKGIKEGIEQGIEQGIEKSTMDIVLNMNRKGYGIEQISDVVSRSVAEVQAMIERAAASA